MTVAHGGGLMLPHPGTPRFLTLILSTGHPAFSTAQPPTTIRFLRRPTRVSTERVPENSPYPAPKIDPLLFPPPCLIFSRSVLSFLPKRDRKELKFASPGF